MGRRNRRKRRIAKIGGFLLLLALLAGAVFLFQVRTVTVYGNSRHSAEEISAGLTYDIFTHNTLYMLWRYKDGDIPSTLPFLESLHVQMKSPYHVEVQVTEKEIAGCIDQGGYVNFDGDGTVLEITDEMQAGIPLITGVSTGEVTLYQKMPTESSAQLRTILSLTDLLSYYELDASEIRFGDNMEITAFIDGVEVQLGQDEYLEEKIANLSKIMPRLEGQTGSLHLEAFTGRNEMVSFTPSEGSEIADVSDSLAGSDAQDGADGGTSGQDGTDAAAADGTGTGADGTDTAAADGTDAGAADGTGTGEEQSGADAGASPDDTAEEENQGTVYSMVFDSTGTLVYNVHVENGVVVDANGNPVSGVTINERGNVVDAYMNEFDSTTGELIQ